MNENKHTPGMWASYEIEGPTSIVPVPVSFVTGPTYVTHGKSVGFTPADANLIAAAPDLLEALKALRLQSLQSDVNSPSNEWGREALGLANAAIAKAEGTPSPVDTDAIIERCAQVADDHAETWGLANGTPATVVADAIRALKGTIK